MRNLVANDVRQKGVLKGGGVLIPFPIRNFGKIPVSVWFLLEIPTDLLKAQSIKKLLSLE